MYQRPMEFEKTKQKKGQNESLIEQVADFVGYVDDGNIFCENDKISDCKLTAIISTMENLGYSGDFKLSK